MAIGTLNNLSFEGIQNCSWSNQLSAILSSYKQLIRGGEINMEKWRVDGVGRGGGGLGGALTSLVIKLVIHSILLFKVEI